MNKHKRKRKHKRKLMIAIKLFAFMVVLALFTQAYPLWIRNHLKVTNPEHTRFDPDKFQFIDYMESNKKLKKALRKTVPLGTSKNVAERRLTKWNNTEKYTVDYRDNFTGFCWNPFFSVMRLGACMEVVGIYYDNENKVKQVYYQGNLFPENTGGEDE